MRATRYLFLLLWASALYAGNQILFLSSYHASFPALSSQLEGINEVLGKEYVIDIEYLDSKRYNPDVRSEQFATYIGFKFRNSNPYDLILCGDDNALRFAAFYQDTIFKSAPIIFFGVSDEFYAITAAGGNNISGVVEKVSIANNLKLIKKMHKNVKKVIAITDGTPTGIGLTKQFKRELRNKENREIIETELWHLEDMHFEELREKIRGLNQEREAILLLSAYADFTDFRRPFYNTLDYLFKDTDIPLYHVHEHGIGEGVLGGEAVIHKEQAKAASKMVKKVLNGTPVKSLKTIMQTENRILFDFNMLKRYGIKSSDLPIDATVINRPKNFLIRNWQLFLSIGIALFTFFTITITLLYLHVRKLKNRLEEKRHILEAFNQKLSERVEYEVSLRMGTEKEKERQEELLVQQSKMAAMGEMVGAIAHQFKQPLSAIYLHSQAYEEFDIEDLELEETLEESAHEIIEQINFLNQTIDDFRNFFKPIKKKELFTPCEAVESIIRMLKYEFKEHSISVEIIGHQHFQVKGRPSEFKQVILNILNNAKDAFIEKKIATPQIKINFETLEKSGTICIHDNAGGIPEDLLPNRIFQSYISTKGEKGTGIGLYISKMIIEESMKGKIFARNVDEGAEFVIELPLKQ